MEDACSRRRIPRDAQSRTKEVNFSLCPKSVVSGKHQSHPRSDLVLRSRIPIHVVTDSSPGLISILRSALDRLGDESTGGSADPAVVAFKRRILRSIAQLELTRSSLKAPDVLPPSAHPPFASVTVPSVTDPPTALPAPGAQPTTAPDSVVVLVARRPRKSGSDDSSGGHSSAA
jgi:hypothetical protein